MTFDEWKNEVDNIFQQFLGVTSDDVEDYLWYDAFKAGDSPMYAFMDWTEDNA